MLTLKSEVNFDELTPMELNIVFCLKSGSKDVCTLVQDIRIRNKEYKFTLDKYFYNGVYGLVRKGYVVYG